MGTELTTLDDARTQLEEILDNEVDPNEVGFLRTIRFFSARATACQSGDRAVNSFCVELEGQFERDLGRSVNLVFITKRPKAVYTTKDGYGTTFDMQSEGWKTAVRQEALRDTEAAAEQSKLGQSKFPRMYGDEWLVYCPEEDEFFLWYYGTGKTMRKDGYKAGDGRRGLTIKVDHRMAPHTKGDYATPRYTPLPKEEQFDFKTALNPVRLLNAVNRFKNDATEFVPRPQNEVSNDDDEV